MKRLNNYILEKLKINKDTKLSKKSWFEVLKDITETYLFKVPELSGKNDAYEITKCSDIQKDLTGIIQIVLNRSLIKIDKFLKIYKELQEEYNKEGINIGWSSIDDKAFIMTFSTEVF